MATSRREDVHADANLNKLPLELLTQILDEVAAEDVSKRSDRIVDEMRLNSNLNSLWALLLTSRRLSYLARERLYDRVRISRFERIQQFANTVTEAAENDANIQVRDLGIDASQYGNMPSKFGPVSVPLPPFLHVLSSLQSLSLNSFYGQSTLKYMLEEVPADLNLFPCLEHCRIRCDTVIDPRALLPFWGAPRLKTLQLEDLFLRSNDGDDNHTKLLAVGSRPLPHTRPLEKLDLYHVGLGLDPRTLKALTGLRAVETLRTELIRVDNAINRSGWRMLIVALAPGIKHLICTRQSLGYFSHENENMLVPIMEDDLPPLGILTGAKSLEITEQQLQNACSMRGPAAENQHLLPPSIERLYVEIDPERMNRLHLYEVLNRLLALYRAKRLPNLTKLELFFKRTGGPHDSLVFSYSHEFIDAWEEEERGLTAFEGYDAEGVYTAEHKAFEQACQKLGLDVHVSTDAPRSADRTD